MALSALKKQHAGPPPCYKHVATTSQASRVARFLAIQTTSTRCATEPRPVPETASGVSSAVSGGALPLARALATHLPKGVEHTKKIIIIIKKPERAVLDRIPRGCCFVCPHSVPTAQRAGVMLCFIWRCDVTLPLSTSRFAL